MVKSKEIENQKKLSSFSKNNQNHLFLINLLLFYWLLFLPTISSEISYITVFYKEGYQQLITKEYPTYITIKNQEKTVYFSEYETFNLTESENEVVFKYEYVVKNCSYMFQNKDNILKVDLSNFYSSKLVSTYLMFDNCTSLNTIIFGNFNTSLVVQMDGMFQNCHSLTTLNLSSFNTKSLLSIRSLFNGCTSLESIDLSSFDTSLVQNMNRIFNGCNSLKTININNFDTSLVTNMGEMFANCYSLESLDLHSFDTSKVKDMHQMFYNCNSLPSLNLENFDTSSVITMEKIFYKCSNLEYLNIDNFDTSKIKKFNSMFYGCKSLTNLNLSSFNTEEATSMEGMFYSCSELESLNLSNFYAPKTTNFQYMFEGCSSLTSIQFGNLDTSSAKSMLRMFFECNSLKQLDLSSFDTSSVSNMAYMFYNCSSLIQLDLSSFDTSSVSNMAYMFNNCWSLSSLNLSNFYTPSLQNTQYMFFNCSKLTSLEINNFNTESVTNMKYMFCLCSSLLRLNINNFYTPALQGTNYMFYSCKSLSSLEMDNFDTQSVTNMNSMFFGCIQLKDINLINFNTEKLEVCENMFKYMRTSLIYCINETKISPEFKEQILFPFTKNCSYFCFKKFQKYINATEKCIDNCTYDPIYKYEYHSICYDSCPYNLYYNYEHTGCLEVIPDGFYLNNTGEKTIDKCIENCTKCENDKNFCTLCNNVGEYYQLFDGNSDSYIKCIKEIPEGHFLDNNDNKIKPCYSTCKKCEILGNETTNNCIECYLNYNFINGNCFQKCDYYYYYDSSKEYQCTTERKCPDNYSLIEEKNQCINNCYEDNEYKYEYNNRCYKEYLNPNNNTNNSQSPNSIEEELICEKYYNYNHTGCLQDIPEGYYLKDPNLKTIDKCNIKCKNCTKETENENLCISCNIENNYFPKFINTSNNNSFIDCYNEEQEGYFLDSINQIYMPCYSNCKKCNEYGNYTDHKCIECYSNDIKINNNCYKNCEFYYYIDSLELYQCTEFNFCPEYYDKLIREKKRCIEECAKDINYKYEYNKICYIKCPNNTKITNNICIDKIQCNENYPYFIIPIEECSKNCSAVNFFNSICTIYSYNPIVKDEMINTIRKDLLNGDMDKLINSVVNELNQDLNTSNQNMLYQITSSSNQNKDNNNVNISTIKLGECETILKKHYDLNEEDDLIIFKIEIKVEGFLIPIIEYEVYSLKIREKLDLNLCNQTKIKILHKVSIDENYVFKHDSTDEFYRDKCYPFTSEKNTDIILDDRKNEFIDKNLSLCEANCEYIGYDSNTKQAECDCEVKTSICLMEEFKIDKDLLLKNFKNITKSMNLYVFKCYYVFFTQDGFFYNIGNYILLIILFIELICLVFFLAKGYRYLINKAHNLYLMLIKNENPKNENEKNENGKSENILNCNIKKKIKNKRNIINLNLYSNKGHIYNDSIQIFNNNDGIKRNFENNKISYNNPVKKKIIKKKKVKKAKKISKDSSSLKNQIIVSNSEEINKKQHNNTHSCDEQLNNINIKYNDYELNDLEYEEAIKYDKRSFCEYYIARITYKQLLLFVFYTYTDYNSKILKIGLFFFFFSLYLTVNALFFSDDTMHEIYIEEGYFNFIYHIPQILYSSIISTIINIIINSLTLSEKNILSLKKEKINKKERFGKILTLLKVKFIFLFIFEFLFLICFWYYLGCFCAVYRNTQSHLIKDTLSSFTISLIYPLGICLIPAFLRIPALLKKREFLFKISKIVQLIF